MCRGHCLSTWHICYLREPSTRSEGSCLAQGHTEQEKTGLQKRVTISRQVLAAGDGGGSMVSTLG